MEKEKIRGVVERSGIPYPLAVLVVRGKLSLNDVLNEMFVRSRRDKLVKEGMDPSLAGQIVRGKLDADRAKRIQAVWTTQHASFQSDRLREAPAGTPLAIALFDRPLHRGTLDKVSRYDLMWRADGAPARETVKKHELKLYCAAEHLDRVAAALGTADEVAQLGLRATEDRAQRFRPTEELALDWVPNRRLLRFVFRDGQTLVGIPTRVARFEIEVDLGEGATCCVLTHALLKTHPFDS